MHVRNVVDLARASSEILTWKLVPAHGNTMFCFTLSSFTAMNNLF